MPAMAGQRCWQNLGINKYFHPFGAVVIAVYDTYHLSTSTASEQVPVPKRGRNPEGLCKEGEKINHICRTAIRSSSVCVVEIAVARQYGRCAV
jgi:hypothetical protein